MEEKMNKHLSYIIPVLLLLSVIGGSVYTYEQYRILVDATFPVMAILLVGLHVNIVKFISEFEMKQQIKKQFGTYMSPELVAKLVRNPELLQLGGVEQELSIQFTDVRGFTSISEHYGKDVQGLTRMMNRYMTAVTKKILENEGTLDKFIGDATMAFWNAPLDNTKHCKDSVKAALEMLEEVKAFNNAIAEEGVPPFGMGVGINTGNVVVGNMGSDQRFDYTCLGDAVNLASRLEGQTKNYGVFIIIGPVTAERLGSEYFTLELDKIAVKGKKLGVTVYTVFYNPSEQHRPFWDDAKELHNKMLAEYRSQNWNKAVELVNDLKGSFSGQMNDYYNLWLKRIDEMRKKGLPIDWDGTYVSESK